MYQKLKQLIIKLKWCVASAIFIIAIGFIGEDCWINRYSKRKEIAHLKGEIAEHERKFNEDKAKLNSLKNNPEAVKVVARERYYMRTDDEDIFIIEEDE